METLSSREHTLATDTSVLQTIHRLGKEVILPAAAAVDREARFPHEAMAALRDAKLLSAYVPHAYGGAGYTILELATIAQALGQYCASTAMIWTMHQIQVACIVQHEQGAPFWQNYQRELAARQLLLASITSEVGVGGDIRSSLTSIEEHEQQGYTLTKKSTAISYGAYADGFLATARRNPSATASDQAMVLLRREDCDLTPTGTWDMLGMRGTCSPGFVVTATFPTESILSTSFAEIATQTMVPFSHLLWSSCWHGIATAAFSRARKLLQGKARQQRSTSVPGDARLVEAASLLQTMHATIQASLHEYTSLLHDPQTLAEGTADMGFALRLNQVKVSSSQLVVQIVQQALAICGMAGYSETSPFSVARHLRDAYSAGLMINNDRLDLTNAALLLIHKGDVISPAEL